MAALWSKWQVGWVQVFGREQAGGNPWLCSLRGQKPMGREVHPAQQAAARHTDPPEQSVPDEVLIVCGCVVRRKCGGGGLFGVHKGCGG